MRNTMTYVEITLERENRRIRYSVFPDCFDRAVLTTGEETIVEYRLSLRTLTMDIAARIDEGFVLLRVSPMG